METKVAKLGFSEELDKNPVFSVVSKAAEKLQLETYVVGGFVRDLILGRPCKDLDFVCVGSGISLAEEVAKRIIENILDLNTLFRFVSDKSFQSTLRIRIVDIDRGVAGVVVKTGQIAR